jgi:hypothetical protein
VAAERRLSRDPSCSNTEAFQARRANIVPSGGTGNEFGTPQQVRLAIRRAILENYQGRMALS